MSITVIAPILNEIDFLPAWSANVERYADEIIVCDTGSTDGSVEFVQKKGYKVLHERIAAPYMWDEGRIRNRLLSYAKCDWIFSQDIDELWGEDFFANFPQTKKLFIFARKLMFCYRKHLVRSRYWNTKDPMDWMRHYPNGWAPIAWKNTSWIRHRENGHNFAPVEIMNLGKSSPRLSRIKIHPWLYHYNYLNPNKTTGVRRWELRETGVRLATYFGPHPQETKLYSFWETYES
jgi:glycosyltransferase involved in cell wall biosynthesis